MDTNTQTNGVIRRRTPRPQLKTEALYAQVREHLLDRIRAGEWRPEHCLPNEHVFAAEYGVSSGTMRKALDQLEAEGVLIRKQGRGTYVREQVAWEDLPHSAKALIGALRVERPHEQKAVVFAAGGTVTHTASDLRTFAEGAIELAAWLDRRKHPKARAA